MAGGVTSGIIYPGAVARIARHYSLHSIGGTSVGAIAAAGAAAAEYRRRRHKTFEGFDRLANLHKELASLGGGHTRLFHLFTPERGENGTPDTRGLFALLTALINGNGLSEKLTNLVRVVMGQPLIARAIFASAVVGILTVGWVFYAGHCFVALLILLPFLALTLCVGVLALIWMLWRHWLPAFRKNNYGICTGNTGPDFGDARQREVPFEGLTPWVRHMIQTIAARPLDRDPLTFGDLWNARAPDGSEKAPNSERSIELAMITSDISRNRAAQLPFLEWPSPLYFSEVVLRRYFPDAVVKWMTDHPGDDHPNVIVPAGVYRLPKPENLPIVFAARLSLSFPILLSAVPLWTPDFSQGSAQNGCPLRQVWFSDGGLTSNFPIHFFDSPMPTRPTFCLNLVDYNSGVDAEQSPQPETDPDPEPETTSETGERMRQHAAAGRQASAEARKPISQAHSPLREPAQPGIDREPDPKPGEPVWGYISMARRNEMAPVPFAGFDSAKGMGLFPFLINLINTARYWSDNQMLCAAGTRDRVVHIGLRRNEGGLNLDMPPATIEDLNLRGRAAAMLIAARFNPDAKIDPETGDPINPAFPNHRWVRYRNFMAAFERMAERFRVCRDATDKAALARSEPVIDAMIANSKQVQRLIGYKTIKVARPYFTKATTRLKALADDLQVDRKLINGIGFDRPDPAGSTKSPAGAAPRPKMRAVLRPLVNNDPKA